MNLLAAARKNWLTIIVSLLLAIFVIELPGYTAVGKKAFYLLVMISLWYMFRNLHEFKTLDPVIKLFFTVIGLNFLWTLFTFYINGSPGRGNTFIWGRQVHLLFLVPLYFLFRHVKISFYTIWSSMALSLLLSFYVGYQDVYVKGLRAGGGINPVLFGSIILCISMYMFTVALIKKEIWLKIISLFLFVLGIQLVIWSGTRGVWLACPFLILGISFHILKQQSWKRCLFFSICILAMIIAAFQSPLIKNRLEETITSFNNYKAADSVTDPRKNSSTGERLEMWKAGWKMFLENPVLGVGFGGYDQTAKANAVRYGVNSSAYRYYHPHNQYISALATRGVPGLVFLLVMTFAPLYLFFTKKNQSAVEKDKILMIFVLTIGYGIFGLSDVPLEGKATILFFVVFMSLFLSNNNKSLPNN